MQVSSFFFNYHVFNADLGAFKGFAFVEMETEEAASNAIARNKPNPGITSSF